MFFLKEYQERIWRNWWKYTKPFRTNE